MSELCIELYKLVENLKNINTDKMNMIEDSFKELLPGVYDKEAYKYEIEL